MSAKRKVTKAKKQSTDSNLKDVRFDIGFAIESATSPLHSAAQLCNEIVANSQKHGHLAHGAEALVQECIGRLTALAERVYDFEGRQK